MAGGVGDSKPKGEGDPDWLKVTFVQESKTIQQDHQGLERVRVPGISVGSTNGLFMIVCCTQH